MLTTKTTCARTYMHIQTESPIIYQQNFFLLFLWKRLDRVLLGYSSENNEETSGELTFTPPSSLFLFSLATEHFPRGSFQPSDHYLWTQLSQFDTAQGRYSTHITALALTLSEEGTFPRGCCGRVVGMLGKPGESARNTCHKSARATLSTFTKYCRWPQCESQFDLTIGWMLIRCTRWRFALGLWWETEST